MKHLITAETIRSLAANGGSKIVICSDSIVTPAARDEAKQCGIALEFSSTCQAPPNNASLTLPTANIPLVNKTTSNSIDQSTVQKIVQQVLLQLSLTQHDVPTDQSGLLHIKSNPAQFVAVAGYPQLKSKTILTKAQHNVEAAFLQMPNAGAIEYTPQAAELIIIMQGSLACTVDTRTYTAEPGELLFLPADKCFSLRSIQQTTWLSVKVEAK